ncbi:MAG: hypothetical protein M3N23_06350 [Pseudomonadota bacterium]|nr:hypothetical protein [Pseudomonadota bacterium]
MENFVPQRLDDRLIETSAAIGVKKVFANTCNRVFLNTFNLKQAVEAASSTAIISCYP